MKTFFLTTLLLVTGLIARAQDAVFIAHSSTADVTLNADDLKSSLLGTKTKWDGGAPIKLGVLQSGPVHEKAIREFTQRSPDQFDKFWKKLVFTGKGMAPSSFASDEEAVAWVAKTPGALAYVAADKATDQVKIVARF